MVLSIAGCGQGGTSQSQKPSETEQGASGSSAPTAPPVKPIKFGFVNPLSGDVATYGTYGKTAMELAVEEINKQGGVKGRPLELVVYDDAADLTQDTFVAAYRSFDGFRAEATPYTWLYRIAINVCKNRFRQLGRRKDMEPVSLDEGRLSDNQMNKVGFSVSSASPERLLEREEMRQMVESAISSLPEDYKIVIVLRDLHGFSYREVAEAAELSVDVVKTRLARAREAIRRKLSHYL